MSVFQYSRQSFVDAVAKETLPIVVDFYAPWCTPCVAMKPVFEKVSHHFVDKAIFCTINVDECRDIAIEYAISSIPTFLVIKNKKVIWSHTGTITESTFQEKLNDIIEGK